MEKNINLEGKTVSYTLKRNKRSRCVRLIVHRDGRLVTTAPSRVGVAFIETFLKDKARWILDKLSVFASLAPVTTRSDNRQEYLNNKERARLVAMERLRYFNVHYGFSYRRISIKNQKTLWGSCSRQGNLNFNYKIALISPALADYIVVHELCHLRELNHSRRFWSLVAETIPDYAARRKELRDRGNNIA